MKKIFALTLILWSLAIAAVFAYEYSKTIYPKNPFLPYLNGDKNFPFVNAREKDYAFYIDKSSIKVKLKAPPFYIISTKIKVVDENLTAYYEPEIEFFYDEENLEMLNRRELPEESWRWRYSTPYSYNEVEIGEAIYYLSQGKKFYGNYLWKKALLDEDFKIFIADESTGEYYDPFPNSFYERLDGE